MKEIILTFDIGTTGNKCTLFSGEGKALYSNTIKYETIYKKPGWSEQKPRDFWESSVEGARNILKESGISPSSISVIGLCGHMNGCIPLDSEGNVLFNDIIHSDSRSTEESGFISRIFEMEKYYNITGIRLDAHYTLPKILWLKNNYPDIYNKTAYFTASKDYLFYRLTGIPGITDFSDASMTGMLDIRNKCWSNEILDALGLNLHKLPAIKKSYEIGGYVTKEAAQALGITEGTPVVIGGGDGACATKGAGVLGKNQAYNYIGSSSWICMLNDGPLLDRDARIFNFYDLDGVSCDVCGTVQCASISYDWILDNIGKYDTEEAKKKGLNVFDYIDSIASKAPAGSNGVFFLPYLMGERTPLWDENTRGGFIGFSLFNKRQDLFRAAYEGIAYALKSVIDVYEENGIHAESLILIGGGARSRLWNEIMCNIYAKNLLIHKYPEEATSIGAAVAAGVGAGFFKDFKSAASFIEFKDNYEPDKSMTEIYAKYYNIYKMMYPRLKPVYEEIAKLKNQS